MTAKKQVDGPTHEVVRGFVPKAEHQQSMHQATTALDVFWHVRSTAHFKTQVEVQFEGKGVSEISERWPA